jgi:hypothetical protein
MTDTAFVRVPFHVEQDGTKTHFLPSCRGASGYRIGEKTKETVVANYWDALGTVSAMPKPTFRRRNAKGNAGGVTCKPGDYEEVSRAFIEAERAKHGG